MAQIVPLPITSQPTVYKDYRPISLLFHLGRLVEQVIMNKLKSTLFDVNLQTNMYWSTLGSTDVILQLIDDCTLKLDKPDSKYVNLARIKFSRVFDRFDILIENMREYGVKRSILAIAKGFSNKRKQCVKVNQVFCDYADASVGAPQGTKWGSIFWLCYVNDLNVDG